MIASQSKKDNEIDFFMKKYILLLIVCFTTLSVNAQYNGYSLSTVGIRVYDASASVLSEINKIPNIEKRLEIRENGLKNLGGIGKSAR